MRQNKKGFTLVELLIAMSFFSFLLLFVTFGFVQVNRIFTKGITVKTIQETSRNVLEDVTRSIRNADDVRYLDHASTGVYRICFPSTGVRYGWNQHIEENGVNSYDPSVETLSNGEELTLYRTEDGQSCASAIDPANAEEILDNRAVIQHLSIGSVAPQSYEVSLVVSTRQAVEDDLSVFGRDAVCKVQTGDQFCDVSYFETVVTTRN